MSIDSSGALLVEVRPCGKAPLAFAVPFERLLHVVASQKEGTVGASAAERQAQQVAVAAPTAPTAHIAFVTWLFTARQWFGKK